MLPRFFNCRARFTTKEADELHRVAKTVEPTSSPQFATAAAPRVKGDTTVLGAWQSSLFGLCGRGSSGQAKFPGHFVGTHGGP